VAKNPKDLEIYAWVGDDCTGTGDLGIAAIGSSLMPMALVSVKLSNMEMCSVVDAMKEYAATAGIKGYLCRFKCEEILKTIGK
jgi:hypothetical protein